MCEEEYIPYRNWLTESDEARAARLQREDQEREKYKQEQLKLMQATRQESYNIWNQCTHLDLICTGHNVYIGVDVRHQQKYICIHCRGQYEINDRNQYSWTLHGDNFPIMIANAPANGQTTNTYVKPFDTRLV